MKTTFKKIKEHSPCANGWKKLIGYYKPVDLNESITVEEIVKSNGIKDAVWALRAVDDKDSVYLFCADVAESVLSIFEKKYTEDKRPRLAIESIRKFVKKDINKEELKAYADAADAAAYAAADADAADAAAYAAAAAAADAAADAAAYAAAAAAAYAAADAADAAAYAAAAAAADADADADAARKDKWKEINDILLKYCKLQ